VLHRFGPLNLEGGERRLNVAITRSRRRMTVVSSLVAGDLDPARLKARGAMMLRDFLAYAADGTLPAASPDRVAGAQPGGTGDHPDALVADFAKRLRATGLVVHESYGVTGDPIDLAVEDPDRPGSVLVAVETDGPGYAAIRSTRDRDRLRGEQLGRLGWMHVRVWSTDLFRDPARDVARVNAAVQQAVAASAPGDHGAVELQQEPEREPESAQGEPESAQGEQESAEQESVQPEFVPTPDEGARTRRVRGRKRRAPEQTKDDTDAGWGEYSDRAAHDRWLEEQRPPHWGSD
jgi:hypothetical protein